MLYKKQLSFKMLTDSALYRNLWNEDYLEIVVLIQVRLIATSFHWDNEDRRGKNMNT